MGRASSNKKVARIASTGGGRTARGRTPWLWYSGITAVVVLGVLLIGSSRNHLNAKVDHPDFKDHWHTAYGIYICNQFKPPMPQPGNLIGIHTHTDGLMHVEPSSVLDTGKNATVGRYASGQPGFKLSATRIQYPGDRVYKNGDKCGSKTGRVEVWEWTSKSDNTGKRVTGDPKKIRLRDQHLVTFAFVPAGAKVPKPPSAANLADPNAGESGTPTTVGEMPTTSTPAPSTTTPPTTTAPTPTTAAP